MGRVSFCALWPKTRRCLPAQPTGQLTVARKWIKRPPLPLSVGFQAKKYGCFSGPVTSLTKILLGIGQLLFNAYTNCQESRVASSTGVCSKKSHYTTTLLKTEANMKSRKRLLSPKGDSYFLPGRCLGRASGYLRANYNVFKGATKYFWGSSCCLPR